VNSEGEAILINIDDLLEKWEDDPDSFLLWIEHCCGIDKASNTYSVLKENVINMHELSKWITVFRGDIDAIESTTNEYMSVKS
jgi:hypothetical protein